MGSLTTPEGTGPPIFSIFRCEFPASFSIIIKIGEVVDITETYHQKFFQNFSRQYWIFREKVLINLIYFSRISQFFCSTHSNLAPKVIKKIFECNFRPCYQILKGMLANLKFDFFWLRKSNFSNGHFQNYVLKLRFQLYILIY